MPPISEALQRVYASAPVDDHYIECMSISHPSMLFTTRYITNEFGGVTAGLEDSGGNQTFDYLPFAVMPPRAGEEANLQLQVVISNVGRDLIDELEAAATDPTTPLIVVYRVYLATDLTTPQNDPPTTLDIRAVTVTNSIVSFTAGITNLRTMRFPAQLYTTELFPGLLR